MEKIQELNLQLQLIAEEIDNYNETELNKAQYNCDKILNSLKGIKKYYSKQKKYDLTYCKELISNTKKIRNQINERILKLKKIQEDTSKNNENQFKLIELDEVLAILKSKSTKKAKITALKNIMNSVTITIQIFELKNQELKKSSKESLDNKNYAEYADINKKIKENWQEIKYYKNILNKCKTVLAQIKNHDLKINYPNNKKVKVKVEKENKYYYLIINDLLNDDKNYLFLKELLANNENFINARFNGEHIVFEILDRYIFNLKLKLVNQKLVHVNPNYYYSLLKIYLHASLDLNEEEQEFLKNRLNEMTTYVQNKKYEKSLEILEQVDDLFKPLETQNDNYENLNTADISLKSAMQQETFNKNRVNLTSDYLLNLQNQIAEFKQEYFKENNEYPSDEIIKEQYKIPQYNLNNCKFIGKTIAFLNHPFAYSINYDKEYNTYLRIHVLDTTFIDEFSNWYQEIKQNNLKKNKYLKYQQSGDYYPTMTYQIKIMNNGLVSSVKPYESVIQITDLLSNKDLYNYRENEDLKQLVGCFRFLENYYDNYLEQISTESVKNLINSVLSTELKDFYNKNKLPSLYYVTLELNEEEKEKIHNKICYYLGKIPKNEAHKVYEILKNAKASRFYTIHPIEESQMELDTRTFIGYNNLVILKAFLRNLPIDLIYQKYQYRYKEYEQSLNKEDLFIDYFNERKLIRLEHQSKNL